MMLPITASGVRGSLLTLPLQLGDQGESWRSAQILLYTHSQILAHERVVPHFGSIVPPQLT